MKNCTSKEKILKESKHLFYDKDFYSLLDMNPYIFGFKNGVVDFTTNKFRQGTKDDYLTKSCNLKFIPNPVALISFISIIINRSEKWGLFLAKYDPDVKEFLFGYGPVQFNEYYSSLTSLNVSGLILPHSSLLDLLIFSGITGVTGILIYFIYIIKTYQEGGSFVIYLLFFQIVNLLKSDSITYVSSLFLLIFTIFLVKNSHKIFKKDAEVSN